MKLSSDSLMLKCDSGKSTVKSARPCGGVYLLPQLEEDHLSVEPRAMTSSVVATAAVVPGEGETCTHSSVKVKCPITAGHTVSLCLSCGQVDSLGQRSAISQCPSCREVVQTETRSSVSEASWTVCFLCSMLG